MVNWNDYNSARIRAEGKLAFFTHLAIYIIVSGFLIFGNLAALPQNIWAHWPVLGWGIGILFHAAVVFVFQGNSFVTQRMIDRELRLSRADQEKLLMSQSVDQLDEADETDDIDGRI